MTNTTTKIFAEHASNLVLGHFNPNTQTVRDLRDELARISDEFPDYRPDMSALPTLPIPAEWDGVWARDSQGNVLTGDDAKTVETVARYLETMSA
ncbi:MAG: hypothetical protein HQL45_15780 [Alphaproteobacteria bacterium]|nr:hypothetical protein [Alphaproteobacteria bacterium]